MANTVTDRDIQNILSKTIVEVQHKVFGKTTIVAAQLPSGFVIVESSSCVDPDNYDEKIGLEICIDRITNKIWELEGYVLQNKLNS